MPYMQITTKCNMRCAHCAYSCTKWGRHMPWGTVIDSISWAGDISDYIFIGGGEPTLHPRFFDVLKVCLEGFDSVGMVTNGSQTETMFRLARILDGEDYGSFDYDDAEEDSYYDNPDVIYQDGKLFVELSQDHFHDPIDERVVRAWNARKPKHWHNNGYNGYAIRDVTANGYDGIAAQGRARLNGYWGKHCVCPDFVIRPNGKIKLCGCENSPVIGDVLNGIDRSWQERIDNSDRFQDKHCHKAFHKKRS